MTRHVVQCFLQHTVHVNRDRVGDLPGRPAAFIRYGKPRSDVPPSARYQSMVPSRPASSRIDGCSVCDKPAHVVERRLRDLADLVELGLQRRTVGHMTAGTADHRSHRGQQLPELVVQLARDLAQRRFARFNQLTRELAALIGERRQLRKQPPVGSNQIQAHEQNRRERRADEPVLLTLNLAVDVLHPARRLLFGRVVLNQQASDCRAERALTRLKRQPDFVAGLLFLAGFRAARKCDRRRPRTAPRRPSRY